MKICQKFFKKRIHHNFRCRRVTKRVREMIHSCKKRTNLTEFFQKSSVKVSVDGHFSSVIDPFLSFHYPLTQWIVFLVSLWVSIDGLYDGHWYFYVFCPLFVRCRILYPSKYPACICWRTFWCRFVFWSDFCCLSADFLTEVAISVHFWLSVSGQNDGEAACFYRPAAICNPLTDNMTDIC